MLKELIEKKRYSFHKGFDNWEEAIEKSCEPLLEQGVIKEEYVKAIIANVKKFGPYIVIAPNVCIPHAQEGGAFVNDTAICFMKTEEPVRFSDDPEQDAQLFFVLASTNNELHMQNLVNMVGLIEDESNVKKLLAAKDIEDLKSLL